MSLGWGSMAGGGAWGSGQKTHPYDEEDPTPPPPASTSARDSHPTAMTAQTGTRFGPNASSSPPRSAFPFSGLFSKEKSDPQSSGDYSLDREAYINQREAELDAKERELRAIETNLVQEGIIKKNNWPICLPIWYHNIQDEIPPPSRRVVRELYSCWWLHMWNLSWQVFCATVMLGYQNGSGEAVGSWFLSIIYWIFGVTCSLWLWYKRIYNAARDESNVGYLTFFLFFLVHIGWCIWCAIAIPVGEAKWSFAGFATALPALGVNNFAGAIYLIGACFWVIASVWAIWCLKDAWLFFRGKGGVQQAKQEAALAAFKSKAAQQQEAAVNAFKGRTASQGS